MPSMVQVLTGLDLSEPTFDRAIVVIVVIAAILVLVVLALLIYWLRAARIVLRERKRGELASVRATPPTLPTTCFRSDGSPADPLNVRVQGTAEQLSSAMVAAGWFRADEVTPITSFRIVVDSILGRRYSTAPVSDLYLFGRRQDYAFQYPGRDVRERDHVRFWCARDLSVGSRPLWVGAATRDVALKLGSGVRLPTHAISPAVDDERDFVVETLSTTGWVLETTHEPGFGEYTVRDNGFGDIYFTDGMVASVVLADIDAPLPFTDKVRAPTAGLARALSRLARFRMPKRGQERIAAAKAALRERARRRREQATVTPDGREHEVSAGSTTEPGER